MKSRHKKLALIGGALAIIGIIAALVLNALNSNIALYITPTEVAAGKAPKDKLFRIGGLVNEGSISRQADGVTISFAITDTEKEIPVHYKGILPDLFKEGKGAVAQGKLNADVRPATAAPHLVSLQAGAYRADTLVAGSAVFGKPDYAAAIAALRPSVRA